MIVVFTVIRIAFIVWIERWIEWIDGFCQGDGFQFIEADSS